MDIASQVRAAIQSQGHPTPTVEWIRSVLPTRDRMPPLPALIATTKARLMAADITTGGILDTSTGVFPADITNQEVKETKLPGDVLVQVLDIENLTKSKWEQVEELEAIARGEQTQGRAINRLPTTDNQDEDADMSSAATQTIPNGTHQKDASATSKSRSGNSTHRLIMQDREGRKVYGLELKRIEKVAVGTLNIGEKILLKKGTIVARGTVLLDPTTCTILGGKVEAWQKAWVDGRLARLREAVGADTRDANP